MTLTLAIVSVLLAAAGAYASEQYRAHVEARRRAREHLLEQVRTLGIGAVAQHLVAEHKLRIHDLEQAVAMADAEVEHTSAHHAGVERELLEGHTHPHGFVTAVVLASTFWVLSAGVNWALAATTASGVGYSPLLAGLVATTYTLAISGLGFAIASVIGLHEMWGHRPWRSRAVTLLIGGSLAIGGVTLVTQLSAVAPYRSGSAARIGGEVTRLENVLADKALSATQRSVAENDLAAQQVRLDRAQTLDRTLAVSGAAVETVMAPALVPCRLVLLRGVWKRRARSSRRRRMVASGRVGRENARFDARLARIAVDASIDPRDIEQRLVQQHPSTDRTRGSDSPADGAMDAQAPPPAGEPSSAHAAVPDQPATRPGDPTDVPPSSSDDGWSRI